MPRMPDEHAFGALAALYIIASVFECSPVKHLSPQMVAKLIRSLAEELCTPEQIAAYRISTTPGGLEALHNLEQDLKMEKMKPC